MALEALRGLDPWTINAHTHTPTHTLVTLHVVLSICIWPCQVWDLRLSMLGTRDNPNFNAKGSETKHMLPFVIKLLAENQAKINGLRDKDLVRAFGFASDAAKAALELQNVMESNNRKFCEKTVAELLFNYLRFASLYERAGGNYVAKHHLMVHCIRDSIRFGNPRFYTTYRSESFNGLLAAMARSCASPSFYADVHMKAAALNARCISKHMT